MEKSENLLESIEASVKAETQNDIIEETEDTTENGGDLQTSDLALDTPDSDENCPDDLDDLDDMLDEFTPVKPQLKAFSGPENPTSLPLADQAKVKSDQENEFEQQLEAELAQFFSNPEASSKMVQEFESAMKELLGTTDQPKNVSNSQTAPSIPKREKTKVGTNTIPGIDESFQDTIKKTMDRMAASGDQATAAASDNSEDNILAEMLKAMQSSNLDAEGEGDEDFSKVLLGMMEQLTNKEILYDPMKELNDKFPSWMEKNARQVEQSDLKRYQEQQLCVREIVQRFESNSYSDESVTDKEYIVDRMQKMQAAGSPPADLVGDMAAAQEVFGSLEQGCPTQ